MTTYFFLSFQENDVTSSKPCDLGHLKTLNSYSMVDWNLTII